MLLTIRQEAVIVPPTSNPIHKETPLKTRIKTFIITAAAATALAVPAVASAEYHANENASCNGQAHGAFGALGEHGARHDLGQGDTSPTGSLKLLCSMWEEPDDEEARHLMAETDAVALVRFRVKIRPFLDLVSDKQASVHELPPDGIRHLNRLSVGDLARVIAPRRR